MREFCLILFGKHNKLTIDIPASSARYKRVL